MTMGDARIRSGVFEMSGGRQCPRCGHLLDGAGAQGEDLSVETVETLSREVRFLRETIARLRGAGAGRSATGADVEAHSAASR